MNDNNNNKNNYKNRIRHQLHALDGQERQPVHTFQFLAWPEAVATTENRWDHMAERIQEVLPPTGHFGLHFRPADDRAAHTRQKTFRNRNAITGDILGSVYQSMLHSQDELFLEGFTIDVHLLGETMIDFRLGGRGAPFGARSIPKHLKGRGLAAHPHLHKHPQRTALQRDCGPRALLLARRTDYYRHHFDQWIADGQRLGEDMRCEDGKMTLADLPALMELEEWAEWRVVVFNTYRIPYGQQGPRWAWPTDLSREEQDGKTVYLYLDTSEGANGHFWWIQYLRRFIGHQYSSKNYTSCMVCFKAYRTDEIEHHVCESTGLTIHQCPICRRIFNSEESLQSHFSPREYPPCEFCQRTMFHGEDCFRWHTHSNCKPRDPLPAGVEKRFCEECDRSYRSDRDHSCSDWGQCSNCKLEFADRLMKRDHRCSLQPGEKFWQPVEVDPKKENTVKQVLFHWAYDFETTRSSQIDKNTYRHEVMAWCMELMIPDEATREYIEANEVIQLITDEVHATTFVYRDEVETLSEHPLHLMLFGTDLPQFLFVVENILVKRKRGGTMWKPTLWAHNGSKFDVKFIFDYYVNTMKLDLAGVKYERRERVPQAKHTDRWQEQVHRYKREVVRMSNVGSKILQMKVMGATYRCSHAHHATALRNLPAMFGLDVSVQKGEFPYKRLKRTAWGTVSDGMPALTEYDIDAMPAKRRTEVIEWWIREQMRMNVARDVIVEGLKEARVDQAGQRVSTDYFPVGPVGQWHFDRELWAYLKADVMVLARSMEAYHRRAVEMHRDIWSQQATEEVRGQLVSPLDFSTSPSWAFALYTTWFMPATLLTTLRKSEASFVRQSLRGGRTDKRAHYVEVTPERYAKGDRIAYFDFKSLYPSVQKCDVHGTHFPVGTPEWIRWTGDTTNAELIANMGNKTGFLRVDTRCLKYVTHPTLHAIHAGDPGGGDDDMKEKKLMFANVDQRQQIYAWPELLEAMESGEVEVTSVLEGLVFEKGESVFTDYVVFFFKIKEMAEQTGNAGLRTLAKLLLNSLWGKLGQRAYSTREWVSAKDRMDYLFAEFEKGTLELVKFVNAEPNRVWFEYRQSTDQNNLNTTVPHIAAYVSMWGRVILHKKVLRVHGQRALYSDTDSAIIYLRDGDEVPFTGNGLGDLTNEVAKILKDAGYKQGVDFIDPYIQEAVLVAPKTYALKLVNHDPPLEYTKVVCKGFEPSYSNSKAINFAAMKSLVWTANDLTDFVGGKRPLTDAEQSMPPRKRIRDNGRLHFKSYMSCNDVAPVESWQAKTLSGAYTKGKTHLFDKRLVQPFGQYDPQPETFLDFGGDATQHYE